MPQNTNHDSTPESRNTRPAIPAGTAPQAARPPRPVPLAVWFVPADPTRPADTGVLPTGSAEPWQLPPLLVEKIISDYASPGSTVLSIGGSAAVVGHVAARLDCRTPAELSRRRSRTGPQASVDLLILTPARDPKESTASAGREPGGREGGGSASGAAGGAGGTSGGRGDWPRWAAWLTPRGILAVVLPPGRPPQQPAAVIAAAVGAGLAYLQHIPAVLWTPGEDELTPPGPGLGVHHQLWRPDQDVPLRELHPAHADVLLFTPGRFPVSSGELKDAQDEPAGRSADQSGGRVGGFTVKSAVVVGGRAGGEQCSGGGGVADGGGLADAEHGGEQGRVGAVGECLFEVAVDPELFEGDGLSLQGAVDPGVGDRAEPLGADVGDQQVGVGGVRPASTSVVQPVVKDLVGQVVQRPGSAGDGEPAPVKVYIGQSQVDDLAVPGCVHGGQDHRDPGLWGAGGLECRGELVAGQGLRDDRGRPGDRDAAGGVGEHQAGGFAQLNSDRNAAAVRCRRSAARVAARWVRTSSGLISRRWS